MINKRMAGFIKKELDRGIPISKIKNLLLRKRSNPKMVHETIKHVMSKRKSKKKISFSNLSKKSKIGIAFLIVIVGIMVFFIVKPAPEVISSNELSQGITISVDEGEKIRFELNGETNILTAELISNYTIELEFKEQDIKIVIGIGDEKEFDLNKDYENDLFVRLDSIANDIPNLFLQKAEESS